MWILCIIHPTSWKTTQSITAAGWDIFTALVRTKEKSCPSQMVKMWPMSGETSGDTMRRYLTAGVLWALSWRQEAHLGPQSKGSPRSVLGTDSVSKAQKITPHIWLLTRHELPLPLCPALGMFSTSHSQPPQMPWWESQGGPHPFSQNNISQRQRPKGWSLQAILQKLQISWHWLH